MKLLLNETAKLQRMALLFETLKKVVEPLWSRSI